MLANKNPETPARGSLHVLGGLQQGRRGASAKFDGGVLRGQEQKPPLRNGEGRLPMCKTGTNGEYLQVLPPGCFQKTSILA